LFLSFPHSHLLSPAGFCRRCRQSAEDAKNLGWEEPSKELNELSYRVIGAAIEVHRLLGPGFLETVYEEAICVELAVRGVPFSRQVPIGLKYKERTVGEARIDLLVDDRLVVELKTVERLAPIHVAQTLSYLKVTRLCLGLIINFNVTTLPRGIKRVIRTH
jgi:GxxExxY protein